MEDDTFKWGRCIQGTSQPEDTLYFDLVEVARLHQRVNDLSWFVTLDTHLDLWPQRRRDCTSYEQGKTGAMIWAKKHEARIRREIAERRTRRSR